MRHRDSGGGGGGGRRDRHTDRRRDVFEQSGHRKGGERPGDRRGRDPTGDRALVTNNNRERDFNDLRSKLKKKPSFEDRPSFPPRVKLNHIEEEGKAKEDVEHRQLKARKINKSVLNSIVRQQANDNTKAKPQPKKSKEAKASYDDPDVEIVNTTRDVNKKFARTVKSKTGAIQIENDETEIVSKKNDERKFKYRSDSESPVREDKERSSSSFKSYSDETSSKYKKPPRTKEKKFTQEEERKKSRIRKKEQRLLGELLRNLNPEKIKSDPSITEDDLRALFGKERKRKMRSQKKSSSESSSSSNSDSSDSSSSSDSEEEDSKSENTSPNQSCQTESNDEVERVNPTKLSFEEESALKNARLNKKNQRQIEASQPSLNKSFKRQKIKDEKNEFYVNSNPAIERKFVNKVAESRSVSIYERKQSGDRSFNDEEARKQKLLNKSWQKSKSTPTVSDIKCRLGSMKSSLDPFNNFSPRPIMENDPHPESGEKRSSPFEPVTDRSKLRRHDSRERSFDIKRDSYDRRARSPVDRRSRSPYHRRERSRERLKRSPRPDLRSRSGDVRRVTSSSSKPTSGVADSLTDWYMNLEKNLESKVKEVKVTSKWMSQSGFLCCNFCGIATHIYDYCTEDEPRGKNPRDALGKREMCLQCGSFSHLRQDCIHTEEKGSNGIGEDGNKFQCSYCHSYDHLTQKCGKIHSEKLGKNPIGISGKKIPCTVCNSFHHLTDAHGAATTTVPPCDNCGEFSHSSQNCHKIKDSSYSYRLSGGTASDNRSTFRWCLLPNEVGNTPCFYCRANHHSKDTCPNKHSRMCGINPIVGGEMLSCSICGSFSHLDDRCFHSEKNGTNQISDGKKLQCIYCKSYNHVVNCRELHNERHGMNPRDASGHKMRCQECGSYSHLSEKCPHIMLNNRCSQRCIYCGSYRHRDEKDCLSENHMIRDFLREKAGYENMSQGALVVRNKWANMQIKTTSKFVEEISAEEIQKQKDDEKSLLERLRIKADPNYVSEPKSEITKESFPVVPSALSKSDFMESGEPENMVYNEPDGSVFIKIDLRTNQQEQPEITDQIQNVITTALTGDKDENIVSAFKIHITRTDLFGLTGENWINDKIVEMYMQMVAKRSVTNRTFRNLRKPMIHCMSTYFFLNLIQRGPNAVSRWTKDVDIFSFDVILIPIHLDMHWCVAIVDFRAPGVFYYDSMGGHNMPALSAILNYLRQEHLKKKGTQLDLTKFAKEIADCPQQQNGADCGIFACKVADFISREVAVDFSQMDMPYFRKRMIWEIVKQQLLTP